MRILIIAGISRSLVNFRGPLIKAMLAAGHEVIACAGEPRKEVAETLKSWGVAFFPIKLARAGMSPLGDLRTCLQLRRLMREHRPDAILAYTIKPVIWGGVAFHFSGCKGTFFALITGLGMAFQPGKFKKGLLTKLVTFLYRTALTCAEKVIFQNEDNRNVFVNRKIVPRKKTFLVSGSGVDLEQFFVLPFPEGGVTFLTIARLLGDKGLRELRQAAAILGGQKPDDRGRKADGPPSVQLLGPEDSSPDGIPLPEVQEWHDSGDLNYLGATNDVRPFIAGCHVYVLPSYHEGMPRTVLEAMAMGRPIITTDAPGCRETVRGKVESRKSKLGKRLQTTDHRPQTADYRPQTNRKSKQISPIRVIRVIRGQQINCNLEPTAFSCRRGMRRRWRKRCVSFSTIPSRSSSWAARAGAMRKNAMMCTR